MQEDIGKLLLAAVTLLCLGAVGNSTLTNITKVPERLDAVEEEMGTLEVVVQRHITQDSLATTALQGDVSDIKCVVNAIAHGETPVAYDCDPRNENREEGVDR